jgi:hypothetical protein
MRPELMLNTCIAAMRLEGCGPESLAFLAGSGLRASAFDAGVEHLVAAMRERAGELRAAHLTPPPRPALLTLVERQGA